MLVGLPEVIKNSAPNLTHDRPRTTKAVTGATLAFLEALVTKPFDRLKVHLMT